MLRELQLEEKKYEKEIEKNIETYINNFIPSAPGVKDTLLDKNLWHPQKKDSPLMAEMKDKTIFLGKRSAENTLIKNNSPQSAIVVSPEASELEMILAKDLRKYLNLIANAELEIIKDNEKIPHKYKISVGKTSFSNKFLDEKIEEETFLIKNYDETLLIIGSDDVHTQYGVYHFLELLGVRFFHPRDEFIPEAASIILGHINTKIKHKFKIRGLHPHPAVTSGLQKIYPGLNTKTTEWYDYGSPFEQMYRHKDTEALKEMLDWLAKNKQNFYYVYFRDDVNPTPEKSDLIKYGRQRGINFCLAIEIHVGYEKQKKDELGSKRYAYWSRGIVIPLEKSDEIKAEYHQIIEECAQNGIDYISLSPGGGESRNVIATTSGSEPIISGTIKRVELFLEALEEKNSSLNILINAHCSKAKLFMLEVWKRQPVNVIRCAHTMMTNDLFSTTNGSYEIRNYGYHKQVIKEQLDNKFRYIHFPETSYCGTLDIDLPLWQPYYFYSLWLDLSKLSEWGAEGSFTYTQGNEWQYWLNNYAAFNLQCEPDAHWTDIIDKYSAIYGENARAGISTALYKLIEVWDKVFSEDGEYVCDGFYLGLPFALSYYGRFFSELKDILDEEKCKEASLREDNFEVWKKHFMGKVTECAKGSKEVLNLIKEQDSNIFGSAKRFYDELLDCVELNYKHFLHLELLAKVVEHSKEGRKNKASATLIEAKSLTSDIQNVIIKRREAKYRYPGYFRISFPEVNAPTGYTWQLQDGYVERDFII